MTVGRAGELFIYCGSWTFETGGRHARKYHNDMRLYAGGAIEPVFNNHEGHHET